MNIKQMQQLKIAFGVVVFFGVGTCSGKINISPKTLKVSPKTLKALVAKAIDAKLPSSVEEETWSLDMLPQDLDHIDDQLDKHSAELEKVAAMIEELRDRDPSHPYLLQLEEVKKALVMLKDRLVAIEANSRPINVDHRVNVRVGGGDATLWAVSTAGYVFGKICDAVKYFGPSILNYYVVSQAFAMMREHRDAMMAMMAEMQRLVAEQAARAGQPVPPLSPTPPQAPEVGNAFVNAAYAAAVLLPILYKMFQGASSMLPKSERWPQAPIFEKPIQEVPAQPAPRAWRILGGEKVPVW